MEAAVNPDALWLWPFIVTVVVVVYLAWKEKP